MTFNEKLVRLRKIKGLTQDEFAAAVGVSRQAVYKWESGQSYPEVPKLLEIKGLFGISIDDLLDESFEIALPEKKKRARAPRAKNATAESTKGEQNAPATEQAAPAEKETESAIAAEPVVEPVAEPEVQEQNTPAAEPEAKAESVTEPEGDIEAETAAVEEQGSEKKGFFARLFGRK